MPRSKQYLIDDLSYKNSWRLFKIMAEFVDAFEQLGDIGPAVSIFGSARVPREDPSYALTYELA
ncbi:MAG: TIGR00730 family Rossman fold protein, partial [Desulfoplanes sp.]|nr:TIGR00730 family Rossman fold protein [Desulfoplanes sp.]